MKPSQLARQLRRIASAIDNSKNPDRTLVARDLKKIIAAVIGSIYRVITDEPLGIAVGFKPSQKTLDALGASIDEWNLVSDDGSYGTPFLTGNGNDVVILDLEVSDFFGGDIDPSMEKYSPLGMDMYIWRSEQELIEYIKDYGIK